MAFLQNENVDIMLVGETWFKPNINFKIPNYTTYRTDRTTQPHGGTAILIKKHIPHIYYQSRTCQIENTIIEINTRDGPTKLIAAYCTPNKNITRQDLEKLFLPNEKILLLGDLNAKNKDWGCNATNRSGQDLLEFYLNKNVHLHIPDKPTHFHTQGRPEILDIGISQNINTDLGLNVLQDLTSDHNPIEVVLQIHDNPQEETIRKIIQWPKFVTWLEKNTSSLNILNTTEDIDAEVETLTREINNAMELNTKEIKLKGRNPIILPVELMQLIKEKRKARKKAQRTLDPEDFRTASRLNNQLREALKEFHDDRWNYKLQTIQNERNGIWKLIKSMKTNKQVTPPILGRNGMAYTTEDRAEVLAESIEAQCSLNNQLGNHDTDIQTQQSTRNLDELPESPIRHATLEELCNIITKLKTRKAPGIDGINNKSVKLMPKKNKVKLLNIINACLRKNYFPEKWKAAVIITIPKAGKDHSKPENHRPISLLPTYSKILERVIHTRLKEELNDQNIIPPEQFGFRESHSCELQTLRLTEIIAAGLNQKHTTSIAYLDISKAFDKVWHNGLTHKMCLLEISNGLVKIVRSFLKDRTFQVRLESHLSSSKSITAGVPQGSVLGPTLYNIFTHDIPDNEHTFKALFADDTALGSQSHNPNMTIIRLQRSLNNVIDWMSNWKIALNREKVQAVCFNNKRRPPMRRLQLDGQPVPWKNTSKYLGVTFDRKLTWNTHTNNLKKTGIIALIRLYPILKNEHLSLRTKLLIYTTIVRPATTYSIVSWGSAAKSHINKIQIIQNKFLRAITGAPWFVSNLQLHRELNLPSIRKYIKQTAEKTFHKAENHENELIRQSVNYNLQDCRVFTRRPRLMLTLDDG